MEIIIITLLGVIGFIIGCKISIAVDKMVLWKEKQNNKKYTLYRSEYKWDKWINGILVSLGLVLAFHYFVFYKFIITSLILILSVFGARLDERIRIIPNELVLVILTIGMVNHIIISGFKGLGYGFLALLSTIIIFVLPAFIIRLIFGSIGISKSDIKLVIVLSFMLGLENVYLFLIGIIVLLLIYIMFSFFPKTRICDNAFLMGTKIMGFSMMVLYEPVILGTIEYLSSSIG